MPLAFMASTIWSLSACFTRGSLAPWPMSSGLLIWSALNSGDRSFSRAWPSGVAGSPIVRLNWAFAASQYGGMVASSVVRLDGPTMSTPQANASGVKASPARVA